MSLENLDENARYELAALSKRLSDDPRTRKAFLKLAREVSPDLVLPEIAIEEEVAKQLAQRDQRISELESKIQEEQINKDLENRRAALVKRGAEPEEIEAIEKIMVEKGIADHETAADYFMWQKKANEEIERAKQAGAPKQLVSQFEGFFKNPIQTARQVAFQVIQESRRPNRPAGL